MNTALIARSSCSRGSCGNSLPGLLDDDLLERRRPAPRRSSASRSRSPVTPLRRLELVERVLEPLAVDVLARSCRTSGSAGGRSPTRTAGCPPGSASPCTDSSLSPMLRTVSIIPGIENFAPDRTDTSSGSSGSPSFLPRAASSAARCSATSASSPSGAAPCARYARHASVEIVNPGGHGQAQLHHLRQVRALAAEQVLLVLVALGEVVDVARHCRPFPSSAARTVCLSDRRGDERHGRRTRRSTRRWWRPRRSAGAVDLPR